MLCKCTICRWCREEIGFFGVILDMLGFRKGEVPKEKVYEKWDWHREKIDKMRVKIERENEQPR